jgi:hypothetical protein
MPERLAKTLESVRTHSRHTEPEDLVFCYPDGTRFGGTWWAKRFAAAMEAVGIDRKRRNIRPHSFRHYAERRIMPNGFEKSLPGRELALPDSA